MLKNDWFKETVTFVQSGKFEMISTFQRNRHFRKVSVDKTFTHVQEQKKSDVAVTFCLHTVQCKITFMYSQLLCICICLNLQKNNTLQLHLNIHNF